MSSSTTLDIYLHSTDKIQKEAAMIKVMKIEIEKLKQGGKIYTALNKEIERDNGKNLYSLKQRDRPS